jgi:MYXO-CTERM domain-containing protein
MRLSTRFQVIFAVATFVVTAAPHSGNMLQLRPGTGTGPVVEWDNDYPFLDRPLQLTRDAVLETTGAGTLTFEYLGHETSWSNSFLVDGEQCFRTGISAVGASCSGESSGGIVNFEFRSTLGTDKPDAAVWSNFAPPRDARPFSVGVIREAPNTFLVLWDDSGAQNDDHDDLGVRIVFEPGPQRNADPVGLMLAGLLGAAGFVRRRQREA